MHYKKLYAILIFKRTLVIITLGTFRMKIRSIKNRVKALVTFPYYPPHSWMSVDAFEALWPMARAVLERYLAGSTAQESTVHRCLSNTTARLSCTNCSRKEQYSVNSLYCLMEKKGERLKWSTGKCYSVRGERNFLALLLIWQIEWNRMRDN